MPEKTPLIGLSADGQPFAVSLNLPSTEDLGNTLRESYGPIIQEASDYRPLASYIRNLVTRAVQESINTVQSQLVAIQQTQAPKTQVEEASYDDIDDEELDEDINDEELDEDSL